MSAHFFSVKPTGGGRVAVVCTHTSGVVVGRWAVSADGAVFGTSAASADWTLRFHAAARRAAALLRKETTLATAADAHAWTQEPHSDTDRRVAIASARERYDGTDEADGGARKIACEVCHVLTDHADLCGVRVRSPPAIAHTLDPSGFVVVAGERVKNNARDGVDGLTRRPIVHLHCSRCRGSYAPLLRLACRWDVAGGGVVYWHAVGRTGCPACDRDASDQDASGDELARRIFAGNRAAALAWLSRSWPYDEDDVRATTRAARAIVRRRGDRA